ncbi:hypothetical protein IFM89_024298 [Coptis chinensis]|uniref:Reverse transcriptase zinc-binding domain-containing protein n=1 Tax=Coptis chinensis TaxID=261450 RepID=A0A835J1S5_9MAGN|nr:hypothetical protein IFM89_024298 [Coptis chinensis]
MLIQGDQWKLPVNFIHLLQHHGIEMATFQMIVLILIVWSPDSRGLFYHFGLCSDAKMQRRGIRIASVCCMCFKDTNELMHLLWACEFALSLWAWIATRFGFETLFCPFEKLFLWLKDAVRPFGICGAQLL